MMAGDPWPLFTVGVVLCVAWLAVVQLTRRVRSSVTATRGEFRLTAQHSVHVIELEGERLVIGTGPASAPQLLCRLAPSSGRAASRVGRRADHEIARHTGPAWATADEPGGTESSRAD